MRIGLDVEVVYVGEMEVERILINVFIIELSHYEKGEWTRGREREEKTRYRERRRGKEKLTKLI